MRTEIKKPGEAGSCVEPQSRMILGDHLDALESHMDQYIAFTTLIEGELLTRIKTFTPGMADDLNTGIITLHEGLRERLRGSFEDLFNAWRAERKAGL